MRHFTNSPSIPFLAETSAQKLDQMRDRLLSEVKHHGEQIGCWPGGVEPSVELMMAEAEIMAKSLDRASLLLRQVAEGGAA